MSTAASSWEHPWVQGVVSDDPILFIVGSYRCGTTSLFDYLAGHPELMPCIIKEPGFFFQPRWAANPSFFPPGEEIRGYHSMFRGGRTGHLKMEATSNYLHDPGCAKRIKAAYPAARILITLRDPSERLVSWFNFLQFQGWLPKKLSFANYVQGLLDDQRPLEERPYPQLALAHGCYANDVAEYLRVFDPKQIRVLWYDDLRLNAVAMMKDICAFLGVDAGYFDAFDFRVSNPARRIARPRLFNAYRRTHAWLFGLIESHPWLWFRLRNWFFGVLEPRLLWLFSARAHPVQASTEVMQQLRDYYRDDIARLSTVVGRDPPWKDQYGEPR